MSVVWIVVAVIVVGLGIACVRQWREGPYLPPGKHPTMFNRRVRRRR